MVLVLCAVCCVLSTTAQILSYQLKSLRLLRPDSPEGDQPSFTECVVLAPSVSTDLWHGLHVGRLVNTAFSCSFAPNAKYFQTAIRCFLCQPKPVTEALHFCHL